MTRLASWNFDGSSNKQALWKMMAFYFYFLRQSMRLIVSWVVVGEFVRTSGINYFERFCSGVLDLKWEFGLGVDKRVLRKIVYIGWWFFIFGFMLVSCDTSRFENRSFYELYPQFCRISYLLISTYLFNIVRIYYARVENLVAVANKGVLSGIVYIYRVIDCLFLVSCL